jgi:hypothetical protein
MTPEIGGDQRLSRVFATMFLAFRRKPVPLLVLGALSFVPLLIALSIGRYGRTQFRFLDSWSNAFLDSLLPPPTLFLVLFITCICFAFLAGPISVLSYRAIYPAKISVPMAKSFRAFWPMFLAWLAIFMLNAVGGFGAELLSRWVSGKFNYIIYVWLFAWLALFAALPAFLSLLAPVFTLDEGNYQTKGRRMIVLGQGFRWRIIGYSMACGLLGLIAVFALAAALVAALPATYRYQLDEWIYLVHLGIFWMVMCVLATTLYCRLRVARGELDPEDIADVFA